ncbi:MAG: hypothetical protein PVI57_08860 [Gemmatimonadota bacterium]
MSQWFPLAGGTSWAPDPEHTAFVDPTRDLEAVRRRWEVRSAQWRAAALAESIFGRPVRVRMRGGDPAGRGAFRGLLRLEVPFRDLELQRWRERTFQACAARDPVLTRVPLVYVFAPVIAEAAP